MQPQMSCSFSSGGLCTRVTNDNLFGLLVCPQFTGSIEPIFKIKLFYRHCKSQAAKYFLKELVIFFGKNVFTLALNSSPRQGCI